MWALTIMAAVSFRPRIPRRRGELRRALIKVSNMLVCE